MNDTPPPVEPIVEQILLEKVQNARSFLSVLRTCYEIRAVGNNLPFEAIEAYWLNDTPLSDEWLDELGRKVCCEQPTFAWGWSERSKIENIRTALVGELDVSQWSNVAQKCLYLLSPLLMPRELATWIAFTKDNSEKKLKNGARCAAYVESLLPLTEALGKGDNGWRDVHAWMRNADSDPQLFNQTLSSIPIEKWHYQDDYVSRLNAHLIFLVIARLLLRVHTPESPVWISCLIPIAELLSIHDCYPVGSTEHKALLRNQLAPLLKASLASTELINHLCAQTNARLVTELLNNLGLANYLAQQPERYRALIDGMDTEVLRMFWLPHDLLESAPEVLLYHERQRFERTGALAFPAISSPQAVVWYQSIFPKLENESQINSCLKWLAPRQPQADTLVMLERFSDHNCEAPIQILRTIDNTDALQRFLTCQNRMLQIGAASRLHELALPSQEAPDSKPEPRLWSLLLELSERHPDLFIDATLSHYDLPPHELDRWALLWRSTSNLESRTAIVDELFDACRNEDNPEGSDPLALAERLYQDDPQPFHAYIEDAYEDGLNNIIKALGVRETPLWALIPSMAARYLMQSTWLSGPIDALDPTPIRKALACYPDSFAGLEEKAQIKLLSCFDDPALIACGSTLAELFAKTNKNLYQPAVQLIARSQQDALRDSGLLGISNKKARKLLLNGIAHIRAPEITPLLHQLINDKAHDAHSRGLMLDNLEARGESLAEWDEWADLTFEKYQKHAEKQKIPAAISKLWNADLAECLKDLGEEGGLFLLYLLSQGEGDQLPRRARQALALIPAGRRADFTFLGVNQWIAENGSDKLKALLRPLSAYGDERTANALVKACKAWKKTRKPKSSAAIRLLCQLPGRYGVAQAHALWESRQFSESIMNNARLALTEVAEREGLSLTEFIEQLVPDFGLDREGLVLDVGPYHYTVKIKPDLSLTVIGPNGKTTKSFPKAKAEEDPDKRSLAENRFKGLRQNLKPVLKQQSRRLARAFVAGKRWELPLWHQLFIEHPLMAIIAQGVVWGAEDAQGQSLVRFRPSDTGEMLDLEDENVSLEGAVLIHIVHPAELDTEERAAWQAHFKDYAVTSPFGQWDVPVFEPDPAELDAQQVTRQRDALLNRGTFGSLMEKWGYQKGPGEDGAMINGHTWVVSRGEWLVECVHSGVSVFFEPDEEVSVEALIPHRYDPNESYNPWKPVALKTLPIALRATLIAQAEALKSAATN